MRDRAVAEILIQSGLEGGLSYSFKECVNDTASRENSQSSSGTAIVKLIRYPLIIINKRGLNADAPGKDQHILD